MFAFVFFFTVDENDQLKSSDKDLTESDSVRGIIGADSVAEAIISQLTTAADTSTSSVRERVKF